MKPDKTEYQRQWYLKNRERILAKEKSRYENLSDEKRKDEMLRIANWTKANPDKRKAAVARHYVKHKVEKTSYGLMWRALNPDKSRDYVTNYRARKFVGFIERVDREVLFARDGGRCGICSRPVDRESFHVDHVNPISKGGEHSYANTQIAHPICNMRKGAREI
jgi:5-methylcytosine-specific restriction endonuclease McrA